MTLPPMARRPSAWAWPSASRPSPPRTVRPARRVICDFHPSDGASKNRTRLPISHGFYVFRTSRGAAWLRVRAALPGAISSELELDGDVRQLAAPGSALQIVLIALW
jgi:hypothetical protein